MKMENKIEMPYGADIKTALTIVGIVGRENKISRPELYKHLPSVSNTSKSYSKKMADFLGLIISNGYDVEISEIGKLFVANKGEENKKKFLANNLPPKYKMLLNWINNEEENVMGMNELKQAIIKSKLEDKKNTDIYDWMLNQFAKFGEYLGVLTYIKGQNSRCEITKFGKEVLTINGTINESPKPTTSEPKEFDGQHNKPRQIFYADINLDGQYPIRILTKDGKPFDWDIQNKEDWKVVEAALEAIKRRWINSQNNNHIGPVAEGPKPNLSSEVSRDNSELAN